MPRSRRAISAALPPDAWQAVAKAYVDSAIFHSQTGGAPGTLTVTTEDGSTTEGILAPGGGAILIRYTCEGTSLSTMSELPGLPDWSPPTARPANEDGNWCTQQDSNLRPLPSEGSTLSS